MRTLVIVIIEPGIQVDLKGFDRFVQLGAECCPEELIQNSPLEPFHKAIVLGSTNLSAAMFNIIKLQVDFKGVGVCSTELSANIRQDRTDRPVTFLVERQHVIVQYGYCRLGLLGGVKEAKSYLVQQVVRQSAERARQEIDYGQGGKGYTFDALKPIDVQFLPKRI
jgi:hypothetical protein